MTGNIASYLVSYLRLKGQEVTLEDAIVLLPIQIVASTFLFPVGARLVSALGVRTVCALGNLVVVVATFGGSYCTSLWEFALVYALGFGIGDGIAVSGRQYMAPLVMGWSYFPKHRGRITGIFLMCFALGSSVFNLISTAIVNPNSETAYIVVPNGQANDHYYGNSVAERFPSMMRWLSLVYLLITLIGVLCLVPVNSAETQPALRSPTPPLCTVMTHPTIVLLFAMFLMSSSTL